MTTFIIGMVVGGFTFWHAGTAVERFRRARYDFTATRRGLRTLVEMMAHRAWQTVKHVTAAAAILVVVFLVWQQRGYR
jgi:hypothetical protein